MEDEIKEVVAEPVEAVEEPKVEEVTEAPVEVSAPAEATPVAE